MSDPIDLSDHTQRISALLFSDSLLVSASLDDTIRIWDLSTLSTLHVATTAGLPRSLVSSPHHRFVVVVYNTFIEVRDVTSGRCVASISTSAGTVAFTPDGKTFITGGQAPGLRSWDLEALIQNSGRDLESDFQEIIGPQVSPGFNVAPYIG